jgi:hypothetical protein
MSARRYSGTTNLRISKALVTADLRLSASRFFTQQSPVNKKQAGMTSRPEGIAQIPLEN